MRFISILSVLTTLVFTNVVSAQQPLPSAYAPGTVVNYIRVWDATAPEQNANTLLTRGLTDVKQTTQYFDGLGRPLQTVIKQGSLTTATGANVDIISAVVYDKLGREQFKYLPFASTAINGTKNDGSFKSDPFLQQVFFYNTQLSGQAGETNIGADSLNWAYSQTKFESSPLSRIQESFAPGSSWVGTSAEAVEGNRRATKTKYYINTTTDSVRIWTVTNAAFPAFGSYSSPSGAIYPAGELFKTITVDEQNQQVIEFKDKEGKVILKKVQLTAAADAGTGSGHIGWLSTYYIYDDLVNLRAVIQPEGVKTLVTSSWVVTTTMLNEQTFRYEYDVRNRMVRKKVPGADEVRMVYDARDRLVLTQDARLRATGEKKWLYTQYDSLNRPVATGLLTDPTNYDNLSYHALRADTSSSYPKLASYTTQELTRTFYDDYAWMSSYTTGLTATLDNSSDGSGNASLLAASNSNWPYAQAVIQFQQLKGQVTGTRTNVQGSSTYLYTVNMYDERARQIQLKSTNVTGGVDISTTQYNWSGQPLITLQKQEKAGTNSQTVLALTQLSYDSLGRLVKIEKKIAHSKVNGGSMPGSWRTVSQHEYDAMGQLKKKKLAPAYDSGAGLESQTYDYNIRGWMLGANRSYTKDTSSTSNWFGFDLGYDQTALTISGQSKAYTAAQYNGNIEGMLWKSTGDDQIRKYDFTYDPVNRLTGADFTQFTNTSFSKSAGMDFSATGLHYDANGNILNMNQRGWKLGGSQTIDSLLYTYTAGSNKLLNVLDRRNDTVTKLGDFRSSKAYMTALSNNKTTAATDYTYDVNGNLTIDKNKDITAIRYNYLNLPDSIVVSGKGWIRYQYDAAGNKLKKVTVDTTVHPTKTTTTLYLGGSVYQNDTLQFLAQEEGRIRFKPSDSTLQFDYFLKDHLGNVRMVLTEETQTDMYPAASLETASLAMEKELYAKLDSGRVPSAPITLYPADAYTNPNAYVQQLSGSGVKIGMNIVLKVMAGDQFNVRVSSWYRKNGATPHPPVNPLTDLISSLLSSVGGFSAAHGGMTVDQLQTANTFNPGATAFLNSQDTATGKPKAYLNWVLFDEQFNFVSASSGFEQVGNDLEFKIHNKPALPITKSGYLYIYVSNATDNIAVIFDNLQVTHVRGPLLEETHYYPFGLTMAGISSKSAKGMNYPQNKIQFSSQILNDDLDIDWYQFRYRNLDPQIGRFNQIDPLANEYVHNSTYAYAENRVIDGIDMEGLEFIKVGNLQDPNFNLQNFQTTFRSESTNQGYQRNARAVPPMTPEERTALKNSTPASAIALNISKGKQLGFEVGSVALEVNEGSNPVFSAGSNGTTVSGNPENETMKGVSVQLGVLGYSGETVSKTKTVNSTVLGTNIPTTINQTTETTRNTLSFGIAKTPLAAGIKSTQQVLSFSQNGHPVAPSTTTSTGAQPYVGVRTPMGPVGGSIPATKGMKISLAAWIKVEVVINVEKILGSVTN